MLFKKQHTWRLEENSTTQVLFMLNINLEEGESITLNGRDYFYLKKYETKINKTIAKVIYNWKQINICTIGVLNEWVNRKIVEKLEIIHTYSHNFIFVYK